MINDERAGQLPTGCFHDGNGFCPVSKYSPREAALLHDGVYLFLQLTKKLQIGTICGSSDDMFRTTSGLHEDLLSVEEIKDQPAGEEVECLYDELVPVVDKQFDDTVEKNDWLESSR